MKINKTNNFAMKLRPTLSHLTCITLAINITQKFNTNTPFPSPQLAIVKMMWEKTHPALHNQCRSKAGNQETQEHSFFVENHGKLEASRGRKILPQPPFKQKQLHLYNSSQLYGTLGHIIWSCPWWYYFDTLLNPL